MSKFKIGDKVRLLSKSNTKREYGYNNNMLKINEIGIIKTVENEDRICLEENYYFYHADDFKLADEWLTPGQALDAHLNGHDLIDEYGDAWARKGVGGMTVGHLTGRKLKIKPEPEWKIISFKVENLIDEVIFHRDHIELDNARIEKESALDLADFIIETYRKEGNNPVWQSTKTAPKDGTRILGYFIDIGQLVVSYDGEGDYPWEARWDGDRIRDEYLLCWMPLPKPPKGDNRND